MKIPSFLKTFLTTFRSLVGNYWKQFRSLMVNYWKQFRKDYIAFSEKYPRVNENIQITFIYFFGLVDLSQAFLNNLFSVDFFPSVLVPYLPYIESFIFSPLFKLWASPEKVFFLSYVIIELIIVRSTLAFSKLVKYNILLVFALLMLQSLVSSYWDVGFDREIAENAAKWTYDKGAFLSSEDSILVILYLNTFACFVFSYFFFYLRALQGKYASLPGFEWLTDSIAFWVRLKTPTMNIGGKKQTDEQEEQEDDFDDLFDDDE